MPHIRRTCDVQCFGNRKCEGESNTDVSRSVSECGRARSVNKWICSYTRFEPTTSGTQLDLDLAFWGSDILKAKKDTMKSRKSTKSSKRTSPLQSNHAPP